MNTTNIMTRAHQITRTSLQAGDSYAVTFAAALRMAWAEARTPAITTETLSAVGGTLWERGSMRRVYFNDLEGLLGLEVSRYGSGNISYAYLNGEKLSNRRARDLVRELDFAKVWWDASSQEFHSKGMDEEHFEVVAANIQARIAA